MFGDHCLGSAGVWLRRSIVARVGPGNLAACEASVEKSPRRANRKARPDAYAPSGRAFPGSRRISRRAYPSKRRLVGQPVLPWRRGHRPCVRRGRRYTRVDGKVSKSSRNALVEEDGLSAHVGRPCGLPRDRRKCCPPSPKPGCSGRRTWRWGCCALHANAGGRGAFRWGWAKMNVKVEAA